MKTYLLLFLSFVLALGFVSAAEVVITPSSPDTNNDLVAYVEGYEDTTFDFYWMKDGATYETNTGIRSGLDSSYTTAGDTWTVSVWVPASAWYDSFEYGSASVTVTGEEPEESVPEDTGEGDVPDYADGNVVIDPSDACDEQDLVAYVEGYEDTTFDFYWMKDGITYETNTGIRSGLDSSYTSPGDTWTVSVWVPASAWYDSFEYGSASASVKDCSTSGGSGGSEESSESPYATDISFHLTEGDFVNLDVVYTDNVWTYLYYEIISSTGGSTTMYVYDPDTPEEDLSTRFASPFGSHGVWQTEVGDAGLYYSTFTVSDPEGNVADAEVMVTVDPAPVEVNSCPTLEIASTVEVTEGDLVMVPFDGNDEDGDLLSVSFPDFFDSPGLWQTEDGDAGVYETVVTVSDGICEVEYPLTITVLEAEVPCEDLNANGVCDSDEIPCEDLNANGICDSDEVPCEDLNANGICDSDEVPCEDLNANGICDSDEIPCEDLNANGICDSDEVPCEDLNANGICDSDEEVIEENTAPVLDDIADIEVEEGETVTITAVASDADGDALTYSFAGLEDKDLSVLENVLTWVTTFHDAGQYEVTVTVSDGELSDSGTFIVKVNDVCDDFDADNVCDSIHESDYEGDLLTVEQIRVLNANDLYSPYGVSGIDVQTSGVFTVEDGYLKNSARDDEIKVSLEMQNRNSFDARDIEVHFSLNGKEYTEAFSDLDRSEKNVQIYSIPIPEGLETGRYPLDISVESDDISYERVFNLDIVSAGDSISYEEATPVQDTVLSLWDILKGFFHKLF